MPMPAQQRLAKMQAVIRDEPGPRDAEWARLVKMQGVVGEAPRLAQKLS